MKKSNFGLFFKVLKETKLTFAESRVRDAFLKEVVDAWRTYDAEKLAIFTKFCEKDKEGKPIIKMVDGAETYNFIGAKKAKFTKEMDILNNEEVAIVITPEIVAFIDKSLYTPEVGEVQIIDEETKKVREKIATTTGKKKNSKK